MTCPNCGANIEENVKFCQGCGKSITTNNVENNDDIELLNTTEIEVIAEEKPKKKKNKLLLIIPILIIIGVIIFLITKNLFNGTSNNNDNSNKQELTTLEKLKTDYDNGTLSVNDYFKQLVYFEFSSDDLDPKNKNSTEKYYTADELPTMELLEEHSKELDEDILKFYIENKTMSNIEFDVEEDSQTANKNSGYEVKKLGDSDKVSPVRKHKFDHVKLTPNKHFLIWYTQKGKDAITDEQVNEIISGLEETVDFYEDFFHIKYEYVGSKFNYEANADYRNAKIIMENNNLDPYLLDSAMSVFIYDFGGDGTCGEYVDYNLRRLVDKGIILSNIFTDSIVAYPFIRLNTRAMSSIDRFNQLYKHELFHHMQRVYCNNHGTAETEGELGCAAGDVLKDAMANFASSEANPQVTSNVNYLSDWYSIYHKNTSTKLHDIVDGGGQVGYALFPYFHAYSQKVNNWQKTLMDAHATVKSFEYIQENTPKNELVDTINYLAFNTISKNYKNKAYYISEDLVYKEKLSNNKAYDLTVNAGSIDYFKVPKDSVLNITIPENDFVTINIYGYESKKYTELKQYSTTAEIDSSEFDTDTLYLAITNGNIIKEYPYSIKVGTTTSKEEDSNGTVKNTEYNTSFNNYNVEIDIVTKVGEIEIYQHSTGIVDELHQKEYLESKTTTSGIMEIETDTKTYSDFVEGYSYTSNPYAEGSWIKEKQSGQMVDLKVILKRLSSMENVKTVSKNHFKVKMTKKELKSMIEQANNDYMELNDDIYIDVYTKDDYITKLNYDFSKAIDGIDTFTVSIKFSNYNNAGDVEIPVSVINNAK